MRVLLGLAIACFSIHAAVITGQVVDATTGEPLARVSIQLMNAAHQALSGSDGRFELKDVPAGEFRLRAATVGYHLTEQKLEIAADETKALTILMSADTMQRTERVEVRADPFQPANFASATEFSIQGNEIKNLASVLADDPLRSVHSAPGVASNDDFESRFSVHGAPYERVGLYLDGILLHEPFHTVNGEGPSGSMAIFNGDLVDTMTLASEGYSARYGDRTAGILDVRTRDGDRDQVHVAGSAGAADAGIRAEGPLGRGHRGTWVMSVRKSYLQYLLQRTSNQSTMAFGFVDSQGAISYELGRGHKIRLEAIDGTSSFDRSHFQDQLGINTGMLANFRVTIANLEWQYAPGPTFLLETHAAYMRERYSDANRYQGTLGEGYYGEWVGNTAATWNWSRSGTLEAGASIRRTRGEGFAAYYYDPSHFTLSNGHRGTAPLAGGYAQQTWTAFSKRLVATAGARWDRQEPSGASATSPQASVAFLPWGSGRFQLSWGQYAQFPAVDSLFSIDGSRTLRPERATHYTAAWEQRLGAMSRLRVTVYDRQDRDLLFRPMLEARIAGGAIVGDNWAAPIQNSLRGYAKGAEFFLQTRTANGVTGWVSYSLGYTRMQDGTTGITFPADEDQRHTANAYLSYRLRPSVNVSVKWAYGSGFPIPGFIRKDGSAYYLSPQRNGTRLPPYQRLDFRINKSRTFDRWKMTIYGEVVNVSNRANYRFDSYNGYDGSTGQAYLSFLNLFPVLPAAGIAFEF